MRTPAQAAGRGRQALVAALLALLALAPFSSCEDKPTAPSPAQLSGTWTATKAEYVSKSSSSRVDLVAEGGSATLVIEAAGAYTYVETPHGGVADTTRGTWSATGDIMTWKPADSPWPVEYGLDFSGNVLRLTGGDVTHDFGQGEEESDHNLVFTR